jgi:hypothetical protein
MEVPQEKPAPGSGDVYFVLEKATLEVAKVGKARHLRLRLWLRRGEDSSQGETAGLTLWRWTACCRHRSTSS